MALAGRATRCHPLLAGNPDWVFITTWNEWWEHTHIEPSEKFGDQYLRITEEYARKK